VHVAHNVEEWLECFETLHPDIITTAYNDYHERLSFQKEPKMIRNDFYYTPYQQ
jgi:hypothetical protein